MTQFSTNTQVAHPDIDSIVHGYVRDGWQPLPLPAKGKTPPPKGYTGAGGLDVKGPDAQAWLEEGKYGNVGLRLPDGVIGIDVDTYGDKRGAATFAAWVEKYGPLPATATSTSRAGTSSRIYFFQTPKGLKFEQALAGGDVEVIQYSHRYAVVWPSLHPEGRLYKWYDEYGDEMDTPPEVEDLAVLPDAWLEALQKGARGAHTAPVDLTDASVQAWLGSLATGDPCNYVLRVLDEAAVEIAQGSRHDAGMRFVGKMTLAGDQGHTGVAAALDTMHGMWLAAYGASGSRKPNLGEWEGMLAYAVGLRVADPVADSDKGCCGARRNTFIVVPDDVSAIVDGDVPAPCTLIDALDAWVKTGEIIRDRFDLNDGNVIKIGRDLGLYETKLIPDPVNEGQFVHKAFELTSWVALGVEKHQRFRPDTKSEPVPDGSPSYTVRVYTRDRQVFETRPGQHLTAEQAASVKKVVSETDAPVALPVSQTQLAHVSNMLRIAGRDDGSRTEHRELTTKGWYRLDGRSVYAAPLGSVDADGTRNDVVVGEPVGSEGRGLSSAMALSGFTETLEGDALVDASRAVKQFIAIAPNRPEIGVALLGAHFASLLHLSRRAAVAVVGEKDSGKSLMSGRLQTFWADVDPRVDAWAVYLPKSTRAGAEAVASWHRDSAFTADDFRLTESRDKNSAQTEILTSLAQGSYGIDGAVKSNATSGVSAQGRQEGVALFTCETLPANEAAGVSRMVVLNIADADIPKAETPEGPAALDTFRTDFSLTGKARGLTATFVQRLARKADELGGPNALRTWADDMSKAHFAATKGRRASETVAVLKAGWQAFVELMGDDLAADALPTDEVLEAAFENLLDANVEAHRDASPGPRIMSVIRDLIATSQAHLMEYDGGPLPTDWRRRFGWVYRAGLETDIYQPTNNQVGWLSKDGTKVLITQQAMQQFVAKARLNLNKEQIAPSLVDYLDQSHEAGSKASLRDFPGSGRARGYVFPCSALNLPDLPVDRSTPSKECSVEGCTEETHTEACRKPVACAMEGCTDTTHDGVCRKHTGHHAA